MAKKETHKSGLSLLELLVVITIIGILIGLLFSAVQSAREASASLACKNKLRQICLASLTFETARRHLPPAGFCGSGEVTWAGRILDHLESGNWRSPDELYGYYLRGNENAANVVSAYRCPARMRSSDLDESTTRTLYGKSFTVSGAVGDYACVLGNDAQCIPNRQRNAPFRTQQCLIAGKRPRTPGVVRLHHFKQGVSKTALFGEKFVPVKFQGKLRGGDLSIYNDDRAWSSGRQLGTNWPIVPSSVTDPGGNAGSSFGSDHTGKCSFGFADGHVVSMVNDTDPLILDTMGKLRHEFTRKQSPCSD